MYQHTSALAEVVDFFQGKNKMLRSDAIKKIVDYAALKIKIEKALKNYKDGKCTIRECAEIAGLRYFEFFDLLAKENLIRRNTTNLIGLVVLLSQNHIGWYSERAQEPPL